MHEYGITSRIVGSALRAAEQNGAARVVRVDLVIGELTFLNPQQVQMAYDVLTRGTLLEASELRIETSRGLAVCPSCSYRREVGMRFTDDPRDFPDLTPMLTCPECGAKMSIEKGKECLVKGIAFET